MKIWVLALLIFISGCGLTNCSDTNKEDDIGFEFPKITDNLPPTENQYFADTMEVPLNRIVLTGKINSEDTIVIHSKSINDDVLVFETYSDSIPNKKGLQILVDTGQLLTINLAKSYPPPMPNYKGSLDYELDSILTEKQRKDELKKRMKDFVQALPVFIVNLTNDTSFLDVQDERVFMIQEAKNEKGEWKPVEYWHYSWCGNSYETIALCPGNFVLVKILKYEGDFETKLRLKLRNGNQIYYSKPFKGTINKTQFDLPKDYRQTRLADKVSPKEYLDLIFFNK